MMSEGQRMVPSTGRNHTALTLVISEQQQCVARSPFFKRTSPLQELKFAIDFAAGCFGERNTKWTWRVRDAVLDALASGLDVGES